MGRSAFTPQMVRNADGSVASSVTPSTEVLQKTAATNYEKAREAFGGAQEEAGEPARQVATEREQIPRTKCIDQIATASVTAAPASNSRRLAPAVPGNPNMIFRPTYAPWTATRTDSATIHGS